MKLVRYGAKGAEKPGLIDKSGQLRDLSTHIRDLDGDAYAPASLRKLAALDPSTLPVVSGNPRLGAPVTGISKFVAIGLNYTDTNGKTKYCYNSAVATCRIRLSGRDSLELTATRRAMFEILTDTRLEDVALLA